MLNRLGENSTDRESHGDFETLKSEFAELKKMHEATVAELANVSRASEYLALANQKLVQDLAIAEKRALVAENEARTDGLTQIGNRKHLDENLGAAFSNARRHSRPLSVIMLDVDHFKLVNDLNSHEWGDKKLQQIAAILKSAVREEDCVARYGGEEFAIVLPETDINGALAVAEKVRKTVEAYALIDRAKLIERQKESGMVPEEKLIGTISVGCAELTKDINSPVEFLKNADDVLFVSKRSGRNKITVYSKPQSENAHVA